jgi:hypothetical protein
MSAENSSPEFEKLQQLLRLKQYEVPPPRYFNEFPTQVTARLRAGEGKLTATKLSWWQQLWESFESKPAFSGSLVAAACGLLVAGVFWAGQTPSGMPGIAQTEPKIANPAVGAVANNTIPGLAPTTSSTNPTMVLPGGSLFDLSPRDLNSGFQTAPASGRPMPLPQR